MDKSENLISVASFDSKHGVYEFFKRLQDLIFSAVAIAVLLPLFFVVSVLIVIDDPKGGPFYSQIRVGKGGKQFRIFKFRSMCVNADDELVNLIDKNEMSGPAFKIKDDPRITRFGKIIRKTCIDELPQLWNVLTGDMSFVGPRPPLPKEVEQYNDFQRQRLFVKPGLTCIWQVTPDKNSLPFDEWVAMDIEYIKKRSFFLDWKLVFKTLSVMIHCRGV